MKDWEENKTSYILGKDLDLLFTNQILREKKNEWVAFRMFFEILISSACAFYRDDLSCAARASPTYYYGNFKELGQ